MIPYLSLKKMCCDYREEIKTAIDRVIESGWYLQGEENKQFEKEYSDYIGTKYCVGVGNGLDALTLIIRAYKELGVFHTGDEIIVPANTYIASILSITENNLTPILVEPNINTFNIDERLIEERISSKTKAVLLVHLYGRCAYSSIIEKICSENGLILIEDNAQAHGCLYKGRKTGSLGNASGHSFYPGKNLGAFGDAGAVTTDNEDLADMVRILANYGSSRKYVFDYIGRNSRLDEIQAAVLRVKLKYLDKENANRKRIAFRYNTEIKNCNIELPIASSSDEDNVYHVYPVLCKNRDLLQKYLGDNGVGTMIHYPIPPYMQKAYADCFFESYPITKKIHDMELSLPISGYLGDEVDDIIRLVNSFT